MMEITCLVLDDDEAYCDLVASYVSKNNRLKLEGQYTWPAAALQRITQGGIQLLFADMEMPEMTGLELIKAIEKPPYVIFITSHNRFAADSYEVRAIDYLIKPVRPERFTIAVNKAIEKIEFDKIHDENIKQSHFYSEGECFFIRTDSRYIKIKYEDIIYIEAEKDFVKIQTKDKAHLALMNLKTIEGYLPASHFIRIHRSYIIRIECIHSVSHTDVEVNGVKFPIGMTYKDTVPDLILKNRVVGR